MKRMDLSKLTPVQIMLCLLLFAVVIKVCIYGFVDRQAKVARKPTVSCNDVFCKELEMKREQEAYRIKQELDAWEAFKKEKGIK